MTIEEAKIFKCLIINYLTLSGGYLNTRFLKKSMIAGLFHIINFPNLSAAFGDISIIFLSTLLAEISSKLSS